MKKLFLPLALVAVLFTSCNDDDSSMVTPEPEPIDQTPTPAQELKLITTSNTSGQISFTDLLATTPTAKSFSISSTDADGVYYDVFKDQIVLASRTNNRVEAYNGLRNSIISSATRIHATHSRSHTISTSSGKSSGSNRAATAPKTPIGRGGKRFSRK